MGSHGIGLFDDDDGSGFSAEILESDTIDVIVNALRAIPTEDWEYLEHPEGMRAIVAGEVVAAQMGHESSELSDELQSWAQNVGDPDDTLISLARAAVQRVIRKSETRDLWSDSPHFYEWLRKTTDLASRLAW